jgi:hypothetical protein
MSSTVRDRIRPGYTEKFDRSFAVWGRKINGRSRVEIMAGGVRELKLLREF